MKQPKKYFIKSRLMLLLLVCFLPFVTKAGGENVWSYNTNTGLTAYGPYKSIAVTDDGVFGVVLRNGSFIPTNDPAGIEVHKRSLNNDSGWSKFLPANLNLARPSPVITADNTGVYVAVKKFYYYDVFTPINSVINITKLSPVDGSIIAVREYTGLRQSPVYAVEVDASGLYVITNNYSTANLNDFGMQQGGCYRRYVTGGNWLVQKWDKSLISPFPVWEYTSQQSEGNLGDFYINSIGMNSDNLFVGGSKMNLGCTTATIQSRLESIDKTTGVRNWLQIHPVGTGLVGAIAVDNISLFTETHDPSIFPRNSKLEKRRLTDGSVLWSLPYGKYITALMLDSNASLDVASGPSGWEVKINIEKVSTVDGSRIGNTTINTGISSADLTNLVDNDSVSADTVKLASDGTIYVGGFGGEGAFMAYGSAYTSLKKFNAFGLINMPPTNPIVTGPISGTINTVYTFSAISTDLDSGDTVRYGFDWNNDGVVDTWSPATGYVGSGLIQFATTTWNTVGVKTFKVLAQDVNGANSGWVSFTDTITITPRLITCPISISQYVGDTDNIRARYWANLTMVPSCLTGGYTSVTNQASWSSANATVATVSNSGTKGIVTAKKVGNTTVSATYRGLISSAAINVAAGIPPVIISLSVLPRSNLIRYSTATDVNIKITASVDLGCSIIGVDNAPVNFSHVSSVSEQTYGPFATEILKNLQKIKVECHDPLNPTNNKSAQTYIEVVPQAQEV